MIRIEAVRSRAVAMLTAVLIAMGAAPAAAQTSDSVPTDSEQTETQAVPRETADPVAPAADESGWEEIGIWGGIVLLVIVALVAWFVFVRPRARPGPRSRR